MKIEICKKCEYEDTLYCCLYNMPCEKVTDCRKVANNPADAKIRVRAKRMLRRNGVKFDNNISNTMLIAFVKLWKRAIKLG